MKFFTPLVYTLFFISIGGVFYAYAYRMPQMERVIGDLQSENIRLAKAITSKEERDTYRGEGEVMRFPSDGIFTPGSVEISDRGKAVLDSLIADLKSSGFNEIHVAVFTDKSPIKTNRDKYPTNWELAAARATSIVRYMIMKGLPPDKLVAISYGDSRSLGSGSAYRVVEIRVF